MLNALIIMLADALIYCHLMNINNINIIIQIDIGKFINELMINAVKASYHL